MSNIDLNKLLEEHNKTGAKSTVALSTGFYVSLEHRRLTTIESRDSKRKPG